MKNKTNAVNDLLPPILEEDVSVKLNLYYDTLHEIVCFGTHVLDWKIKNAEPSQTTLTIVMFYRRILELVDSISILLKTGTSDPCEVLLRSLLETTLSLEYLLKTDTDRRALCYHYLDYARKLSFYLKHNPKHQAYKDYSKDYTKGYFYKTVPEILDLDLRVEQLNNLMAKPELACIKAEYDRLKKISNGAFKWYFLFEGPKDVQKLASHLNKFDLYELLYKDWSDLTHATNILAGNIRQDLEGITGIVQLRNPTKAQDVTIQAIAIAKISLTIMAKHIEEVDKNFKEKIDQWEKKFQIEYVESVHNSPIDFEEIE